MTLANIIDMYIIYNVHNVQEEQRSNQWSTVDHERLRLSRRKQGRPHRNSFCADSVTQ